MRYFSALPKKTTALGPVAALALLLLGSRAAYAQGPVLTSFSPVRNAIAAPLAANVALTFSQPISAASAGNVRVFSQQRGGQLNRPGSGTLSGGGTNTLTFDPATNFNPGETVSVTVPATVQGVGGAAVAPHVHQFTAGVVGGTGVFVAPVVGEINTGGSSKEAVVGDVDGDGDLDLITSSNPISVTLNDGRGNFSGTTYISSSSSSGTLIDAGYLMLGDLDNDGDLDLVSVHRTSFGFQTARVNVYMNNGTGVFSGTGNMFTTEDCGFGAAIGDLDGDGDLDLLTPNFYSLPTTTSVRLNNGSGAFNITQNVNVGNYVVNVATGDVDGDGDLDFATTNVTDSTVSVRLNDGNANFSGTQDVSVGASPSDIEMVDVDGDSDLDLLVSNYNRYYPSLSKTVSVRFNNGSGIFSGTQEITLGDFPESIATGDIDDDGDFDLLAVVYDSLGGKVSVWLNNGMGIFSGAQILPIDSPLGITMGDLDGDGDLDLLTVKGFSNTVSIRLNGGTGPTLATKPPTITTPAFTLHPNPAPATEPLRIVGAPPHQSLAIHDATGRRITTLPTDATGAATLRPGTLAPGLYVVRAADGRTRRLVVE